MAATVVVVILEALELKLLLLLLYNCSYRRCTVRNGKVMGRRYKVVLLMALG